MKGVSIIGVDLAKNSFQLHGASADGGVVFRKKLSRSHLIKFLAAQPKCIVAMEACVSAHHWGRKFEQLGHDVHAYPHRSGAMSWNMSTNKELVHDAAYP